MPFCRFKLLAIGKGKFLGPNFGRRGLLGSAKSGWKDSRASALGRNLFRAYRSSIPRSGDPAGGYSNRVALNEGQRGADQSRAGCFLGGDL